MVHNFLLYRILAEYEKGDQSPYFPWLNSLPRQFYNGVSMTDDCFDCLLPYVSELSRKEREDYVVFTKVLQSIQFLDSATLLDKELIKWAYNVALTRSTLVGTRELRIAPMADYFNHGAETEAEIKFDNQGNCLVSATRDVPAGSPLRISSESPRIRLPLCQIWISRRDIAGNLLQTVASEGGDAEATLRVQRFALFHRW